jgi:hypothetical protein
MKIYDKKFCQLKNNIYICIIKQSTMKTMVIRNLNGTDRKVTKFLFIPEFIKGKIKWLTFVTIHEDYVDGEWIQIRKK